MSTIRSLHCAIAALLLAAFMLAGGPANARYEDSDDDYEPIAAVVRGTPVLAVVALAEQRVSIYDTKGTKMMEAPVSSGQSGLETPAGIFSIVQKEEEHHSNLFDDASMPFMERITWTGISLHAGVLPGHPASHGCVRMPHRFAEQLYDVTKLGMRVLIVREDIAPAEIAQPAMFTPAATAEMPAGPDLLSRLQAAARTKYMDSAAAQRLEKEAKQAAAKKSGEAEAGVRAEHAAEAALAKAEADLKDAEHAPETAAAPAQAEAAKAQALAKAEAARAQLEAAKLESQTKAEAAQCAKEELREAAAGATRAADASEEAQQRLSPVSVFISRKTQRLYIRRNNLPVFESYVTIRDADKPIGSFVFTALDYDAAKGGMRWSVVSMYKNAPAQTEPRMTDRSRTRHSEAAPADVSGAQAALARLAVPQEAQERISAAVLPGASLIVSDEGPSGETGKDTDFIVVMSGEPMGGLTSRHRPSHREGDEFEADGGFFGRFSTSGRGDGGGGGGFPFFFRY